MANKPKNMKPRDNDVIAANEIYEAGKRTAEAEIARLKEYAQAAPLDHQAIGEMRMLSYQREHIEMLELLVIYRVKVSKDYKKCGMTWEQFCDAIGKKVRTLDTLIAGIRPAYETVSAKLAAFAGIDAKKIKYLGRAILANSAEIKNECICYGGEKIPLTPAHHDEIQSLLEKIESDLKQQIENAQSDAKAAKKIAKAKEDVIAKQEKDLRKFEKRAEGRGLSLEEDAFEQQIENLKISFDGYMSRVEPGQIEELQSREDGKVTPRMRALYLTTLDYMRKQIVAAHDTAVEQFGADLEDDKGGWRQPQ